VPTYRKLHDFMRDEYIPKARLSHGMDALPDGKAWYAYNVKRITTTDYTPEQIHQIGLDEVKRIHGEMQGVMQQVGFEGSLPEFFKFMNTDPQFFFDKREDLIAGYEALRNRVNPQLPKLFEILPKADYEVRAVEPFREKSAAGGQYQAASEDGSRPGIFYANAYDLRARQKWAMEALSLHEANPGHHFQISIQREQQEPAEVPPLRRVHGIQRRLGPVCGSARPGTRHVHRPVPVLRPARSRAVARHPARRRYGPAFKGLDARAGARIHGCQQLRCRGAPRLRGRALHGNPGPGAGVQDRPAEDQRVAGARGKGPGPRFDVRKFHTVVLEDGALPLDVLEAKVDRWIAAQ
jgi:uncharacterized protein (DUF885 family)